MRRQRQEVLPPPSNPTRKAVWGAPPSRDALHEAIEWTRSLPAGTRSRAVISARGSQVVVALQGTAIRQVFA